jgi:topoisomerase-4 subunit A
MTSWKSACAQLARLEAIRIEQELQALREEQGRLEGTCWANPASLRRLMVRENRGRRQKTFGDARRTLIQPEKKAVAEIRVVDEPVTVVVSAKGWVAHAHRPRARGDGVRLSRRATGCTPRFRVPHRRHPDRAGQQRPGLQRAGGESARRAAATASPSLRSSTWSRVRNRWHFLAGAAASTWLLSGSGGHGLLATVEDMTTRQRGGKAFLTLAEGEVPCLPSPVRGHGRVQ